MPMPIQENPFKFGTVVDGDFFTDRKEELPRVMQMLSGHNHLIIISPRRYGKTSLVRKAIVGSNRPAIFVNVQMALSASGLADLLLKSFLAIYPWERFKEALKRFRVKPVFSYNSETNSLEVSFGATGQGHAALEDVLALIEEKSDPKKRLIVVLDEFQEIANLEPGTDKLLRAIMQLHKNINYLFLGSEESMMSTIFEDVKSPFFHFGALMHLKRIPYEDFYSFLVERLAPLRQEQAREDACIILELTKCHPFYTQQLAAVFWDLCMRTESRSTVLDATTTIVESLSASYMVLWSRLNRTSRRILEVLSRDGQLPEIKEVSTSTVYTAVSRLKKEGILIREKAFALEDPFFALWIRQSMQNAASGISPAPQSISA